MTFLVALLLGQSVELPATVTGKAGAWIIVAPTKIDGGAPQWEIDKGLEEVRLDLLFPADVAAKAKGKVVTGEPGVYEIRAWNAKADVASKISRCRVTITGILPPVPPGPTPPGPTPDPTPSPAPIPSAGLRVLILYETSELSRLPISQASILSSTTLRHYLDEKCVKVGQTPEYRVYDKDTDLTNESELWRAAAKRPASKLPFLIVSNGKTGWEGPLPTSLDETMAIIKRHEQ